MEQLGVDGESPSTKRHNRIGIDVIWFSPCLRVSAESLCCTARPVRHAAIEDLVLIENTAHCSVESK